MILYTMMPNELIFPVQEDSFSQQQFIEMNGVSMIVEKSEEQQYRIVRLLSTDPQHYLSEEYMPGMNVTLPPRT
jgi:hypothetical protein